MIRLISIIAVSLVTVSVAMQDQSSLQQAVTERIAQVQEERKLKELVPTGLNEQIWPTVINWYPNTRLASTCCGDLHYCDKHGIWTQIRKGEYATLEEFVQSVDACNFGFSMDLRNAINLHIARNDFQFHAYHDGTKTLMYPIHAGHEKEKEFRRHHSIIDKSCRYCYPSTMLFECDGVEDKAARYEMPCISPEGDTFVGCACSNDGIYYAACNTNITSIGHACHYFTIKVLKQLADGSYYANASNDLLMQGNEEEGINTFKQFIEIVDNSSSNIKVQDLYFSKDNHVNVRTIVPKGAAKQWIISPVYGSISSFPCCVDCDDNKTVSLGALSHFDGLYEKVIESPSKLCITSPKIRLIKMALRQYAAEVLGEYFPIEIEKKILYDMCYYSNGLHDTVALVYEPSLDVLSRQDKKLIYGLDKFKRYYDEHNSSKKFQEWKNQKQAITNSFVKDSGDTCEDLWSWVPRGVLLKEKSCFWEGAHLTDLLWKALFQQLDLPKFQIIHNPLLAGELILDPEGKISVNGTRFCSYLRSPFYKEYKMHEVDDGVWGTQAHAQQFVRDNTVQEIDFKTAAEFDLALCNGIRLPVRYGIATGWNSLNKKADTGIIGRDGYWKSKYDSRTQEEIEAELSEWQ